MQGPPGVRVMLALTGGFAFLSGIAASIGLLLLKRWAAWLFLLTTAVAYTLMAFLGPTVEHGVTSAVNGAFSVVTGVILGLAFFTDALPARGAERGRRSE